MADGDEMVKNWIYRIHGGVQVSERGRGRYDGRREFWGEVLDQAWLSVGGAEAKARWLGWEGEDNL